MDRLFKSLIKINNIIGFLPSNLGQVIAAVLAEFNCLLTPFEIKVHLKMLETEKEELAALITGGMVVPAEHHSGCKAIADRLPVIVEDNSRDRGCPFRESSAVSYSCIPIIAGKEVLGTVSVTSDTIRPLLRDELEVLVSVVNQLGVAIQRCRLLRSLEEEKKTLARANDEISALNWELSSLVQHLQETQAQLVHSEKLAATGRLAANIAHEINNPVGIILSRLDCVFWDEDKYPDSRLWTDLRVIQRQAKRVAEITRGLLSLTRKSTNSREHVDLSSLAGETVGWLEDQFKKQKIRISFKLSETYLVLGNPEQLQQVVVNLLVNARDAMPDGGVLTVSTGKDIENKRAVLEISDTGMGISDDEKDKIFEPFYTSKEPGKGTGLGLYISYSIIKENRGEIKVKSAPGQGTTFGIYLPAANPGLETRR